jgi:hypothetical protein
MRRDIIPELMLSTNAGMMRLTKTPGIAAAY